MHIESKLPNLGVTIFTVMSQLAQQHQAINLSQGFPDFEPPKKLLSAVKEAMDSAKNQYAPMTGIAELRQVIADKTQRLYGYTPNVDAEITVTSGATEALFCAISSVVRAGDEVIIFDPAYDSYAPVVELCGGKVIRIPLDYPKYSIDWQQVVDNISDKTRLLIINTPHNPTGAVLSEDDISILRDLAAKQDFFILSDEVYEHIVFDQKQHLSMLRFDDLRERAFVVSSFGKTLHCTGWKLGYCIAPQALSAEFRKIHQYNTFSTSTPMQYGIAEFLQNNAQHYLELPGFYQKKRDYFLQAMAGSRLKPLSCAGTYFQCFDYSEISDEPDQLYAEHLTREIGVAAIPLSVFNGNQIDNKVLRFCFAKDESILSAAAEKLLEL